MTTQEKFKYVMLFLLGGIVFLMLLSIISCTQPPSHTPIPGHVTIPLTPEEEKELTKKPKFSAGHQIELS